MSNDAQRADQIAFHIYTKLFYVVNHARASAEPRVPPKLDKWFNLETPDSDLLTKEARDKYKSISSSPSPPPFEIQVLLSVPDLTSTNSNQVLVHLPPDPSRPRLRVEPTPSHILLERWVLTFTPQQDVGAADVALPTIYKHGIPLFRSLFSLLRILPAWKLHKRLRRRTGGANRNGNLAILLRVRTNPGLDDSSDDSEHNILGFDTPPSPTTSPLPSLTHTFPPIPHTIGTFSLSATYLASPNFQLDELESLLSSRFLSLDHHLTQQLNDDRDDEGFVPTLLAKHISNSANNSVVGSVSSHSHSQPPRLSPLRTALPSSSSASPSPSQPHTPWKPKSPPRSIFPYSPSTIATTASRSSSPAASAIDVADRFILPSRTPTIPPPTPPPLLSSFPISNTGSVGPSPSRGSPFPIAPLPLPASSSPSSLSLLGQPSSLPSKPSNLTISRLRKESTPGSSGMHSGGGVSPSSSSGAVSVGSGSPREGHTTSPTMFPFPFKSNTLAGSASPVGGGSSAGSGGSYHSPGQYVPHAATQAQSHAHSHSASSGLGLGLGLGLSRPGTMSSPGSTAPGVAGTGTGTGARSRQESPSRSHTYSQSQGSMGGVVGRPGAGSPLQHAQAQAGGSHQGGEEGRAMPGGRKRYSSSFGYRYPGAGTGAGSPSTSTSTSGGVVGPGVTSNPSPSQRSASRGGGAVSDRGGEASVGRGEDVGRQSPSFLNTATDDDDISNFVQDIDARKPLRGREREREERVRVREQRERERLSTLEVQAQAAADREAGQGHERNTAAADGGDTDDEDDGEGKDERGRGREDTNTNALFATNKREEMEAQDPPLAAAAAGLSLSPPAAGAMLTTRVEVDEKLRAMNEVFLASLEGLGGSTSGSSSRRGGREARRGSPGASSRGNESSRERERTSPFLPPASGLGMARRGSGSGYGYGYGRGSAGGSTSTSVSQGSEEVIGRMDFDDAARDRRRRLR